VTQTTTPTVAPTVAEFTAVLLSRHLQDEAVGILGTRSEIAEAACALAQATHAPGLWYLSGPRHGHLRPIADEALIPGSEALLELSDNIDIIDWSRRTWDFAVLGGIQVDQFGNLNTVTVGDWAAPKVRGPGAIGAPVLAGHAAGFFIVMNEHTVRNFRPQVDFVSALGFGRTGQERAQLRLPGRGPQLLISPLGVFDFTPDEHRMRLRSLHAWSSLEEVRASTGFDLVVEDHVPTTAGPDPEELRILREHVDRTGVLRRGGSS